MTHFDRYMLTAYLAVIFAATVAGIAIEDKPVWDSIRLLFSGAAPAWLGWSAAKEKYKAKE